MEIISKIIEFQLATYAHLVSHLGLALEKISQQRISSRNLSLRRPVKSADTCWLRETRLYRW